MGCSAWPGPLVWGLREEDRSCPLRDLLHLDLDPGQAAAVGDPFLVEAGLGLGEAAGDRLAVDRAGPLPVGPVELGRIGMAAGLGLPQRM